MTQPRICLSVYGSTEEICNFIQLFDADLFEIRLDLSDDPNGSSIRAATRKPLLFTAHGRPDLLEKYWPFADYVDVQQQEATGQNTIVSVHAEKGNPELLWNRWSGRHITKIVLETEDYDVMARLLELNRKNKPFAICFASGEVAGFTRILSVLHGARWIYASLPGRSTGPGQFLYEQLIHTYRLQRYDARTGEVWVFGIVGNPVSHSRSPDIHNSFFAEASLHWIYLPFLCKDLPSLLENAPKWGSKGFSITHPYKQQVLTLLDSVSPEVERLGSCNTIAHVNGLWIGTNTDLEGITALLEDVPYEGRKVVIIGAGASAKAFAFAIGPRASDLLILGRNKEKTEMLAAEFQAKSGSLRDLRNFEYDVLIQATPVGWDSEEMPMDPDHLREGKIVIDSIYKETTLLKKARELGCRTINGKKWFEVQAQAQFRWWKEVLKAKVKG